MSGPLFGTDGVRAAFGTPPLDCETVQAVGYSFARLCSSPSDAPAAEDGPLVVLGGDTRASRLQIVGWLAAACVAAGARVRSAGVVPTPAVARLVTELEAAGGIVVSASHNPHTDNGLKLFGRDGFKVDAETERRIEKHVARYGAAGQTESAPTPLAEETDLADRYLGHLERLLPGRRPLRGLRLAVDAANGAGAPLAERLFHGLGAVCHLTADRPNGRNINRNCGSTCTGLIAAFTRDTGSDLGTALDGDADRALLSDHRGRILDGDALLFVWARHLSSRGELPGNRIVATTMSNMGLERALDRHGVAVVRCGIGDREVVSTMRQEGIRLGGEQSGHLVDLRLATTGDGLLTTAVLASIVAASDRPLADLAADFRRFPQVLVNVRVTEKRPLDEIPGVVDAVAAAERQLGSSGRVMLRYSGTEALARVMVEGPDRRQVNRLAATIAGVLDAELGE